MSKNNVTVIEENEEPKKEVETITIKLQNGYWIDENHNCWKAKNITVEQAVELSETLIGCEYCIDCSNCINCCNCEFCHNCNNCDDCYACMDCKKCIRCIKCKDSLLTKNCSDLDDVQLQELNRDMLPEEWEREI